MEFIAQHSRGLRLAVLAPGLCVLWLVVGACGGTKPTRTETIERYGLALREAVSTRVTDPDRRAGLLKTVDQLEALHLRFSEETEAFIRSYRALNADYDAPRPAFEKLFSEYNARRVAARKEALDLHFQLASHATDEEWAAIGKAEAKLYGKATLALPAVQDKG